MFSTEYVLQRRYIDQYRIAPDLNVQVTRRAYRRFGGWVLGLHSTDNKEKLIVKLEQSGYHAGRNI